MNAFDAPTDSFLPGTQGQRREEDTEYGLSRAARARSARDAHIHTHAHTHAHIHTLTFFLSLSLSLSLTHTHTHTHKRRDKEEKKTPNMGSPARPGPEVLETRLSSTQSRKDSLLQVWS